MNEEILNEDLALDIERAKNMTLIGDRILILLDKATDTITSSGILIPKLEMVETDGGKLKSRPSDDSYLLQGTIINMSLYSIEKFKDLSISVSHNNRVILSPQAKNTSFQFFPDRSQLVSQFKGIICVPHTLIEAKID
jgi:co-chaperonin GroES (HSP10)